jgi:hypothetical protein
MLILRIDFLRPTELPHLFAEGENYFKTGQQK